MNYAKAIAKFEIVDKSNKSVPFLVNKEQQKLLDEMTGRDVILKCRQIGFSSLILGIFSVDFLLRENWRGVILSHDGESAQILLDKAKGLIKSAEDKGLMVKLKYNSRHEIVNELKNSSLYIGKAGSKSFGRGDTLSALHLSEFAWLENPQRLLASILQAVTQDFSKVFIESTANGLNFFKEFWDRTVAGQTGFKAYFFGRDHYSQKFLEQKEQELGSELFLQEYPSNPTESFLSSGNPFFDKQAMSHYLDLIKDPIESFQTYHDLLI